jgi:hypothetical protein
MKIKKRKLFEAVEDMGSDSTAAMGENVENFEGIDVAEAFKKLNKLDETTQAKKISNALFGDKRGVVQTFAIISAENPAQDDDYILDTQNLSKEEKGLLDRQRSNAFRRGLEKDRMPYELKRDTVEWQLAKARLRYIKMLGDYGEKEYSFFIFNLSLQEAERYAADWGQESFWFGSREKVDNDDTARLTYFETADRKSKVNGTTIQYYKPIETTNIVWENEAFKEYFSQIGKFKFHIATKYFKDLENISTELDYPTDLEAFNESLRDGLKGLHRISCRIRAYEKKDRAVSKHSETITESIDTTLDALKALNKLDE